MVRARPHRRRWGIPSRAAAVPLTAAVFLTAPRRTLKSRRTGRKFKMRLGISVSASRAAIRGPSCRMPAPGTTRRCIAERQFGGDQWRTGSSMSTPEPRPVTHCGPRVRFSKPRIMPCLLLAPTLADKIRRMVPHRHAASSYRSTGPAYGRPEDRLRPVSRAAMGPGLRRDDKRDRRVFATWRLSPCGSRYQMFDPYH